MKISIVLILNYVITTSWCQDKTVFHCSDKRIDENLHDKEFPITCKSMNATESSNTGNWLPVVTQNSLEIRENRNKIAKQTNEMKDFRDRTLQQSRQIDNLLEENKEQNSEIRDLRKESRELRNKLVLQSAEIVDLKKSREEQSREIGELKNAMGRIKEKFSATEKPQQVQSGNQQRPTTTTKTTLKPTPSPENCKLKIENMCYFAVIHDPWDVDYDKAVDICKKRNADVGLIRDEESFNAIMNYLVKYTPMGFRGMIIWTRIRFDPMTRDVTPADSFIKWSSPFDSFPRIGIKNKDRTNVYLHVDSKLIWHSMGNASPTLKLNGVICEIQI
ncbi:uncharacterized protein LOC144425819 [Styela clava]